MDWISTGRSAERDGLGRGRVNDLRFDPDGNLWIAAEGGLSRLNNGRITRWNARNGLLCDSVHWLCTDSGEGPDHARRFADFSGSFLRLPIASEIMAT